MNKNKIISFILKYNNHYFEFKYSKFNSVKFNFG